MLVDTACVTCHVSHSMTREKHNPASPLSGENARLSGGHVTAHCVTVKSGAISAAWIQTAQLSSERTTVADGIPPNPHDESPVDIQYLEWEPEKCTALFIPDLNVNLSD